LYRFRKAGIDLRRERGIEGIALPILNPHLNFVHTALLAYKTQAAPACLLTKSEGKMARAMNMERIAVIFA
jgi:hypothetical protein